MRTQDVKLAGKIDSWGLAALVLRENRIDLIKKFNAATGAPSYNVAKMQYEFIEGQMNLDETIAFAKVCFGLIDAARKAN